MKSLFVLACLAASALAQNIAVGAPADLSTVARGQNFTVEVDKPITLTGSEDVAIAIGLESCSGFPDGCAPVDITEILGTILYLGPYKPELDPAQRAKPPYQNFSVQVPTGFPTGPASLSVAHFVLTGAGPEPDLDVYNITVIVQ